MRFVKATKYRDAHWVRTETEYMATLYTGEDYESDCHYFDTEAEAIAEAKGHDGPAVVEKIVTTDYSYDKAEWEPHPDVDRKETVVWKSAGFPVDLGFDDE